MDKVTNYMDRMIAFKNGNQQFTQIWHGGKCVYDLLDSLGRWEPGLKEILEEYPQAVYTILKYPNFAPIISANEEIANAINTNRDIIDRTMRDYKWDIDKIISLIQKCGENFFYFLYNDLGKIAYLKSNNAVDMGFSFSSIPSIEYNCRVYGSTQDMFGCRTGSGFVMQRLDGCARPFNSTWYQSSVPLNANNHYSIKWSGTISEIYDRTETLVGDFSSKITSVSSGKNFVIFGSNNSNGVLSYPCGLQSMKINGTLYLPNKDGDLINISNNSIVSCGGEIVTYEYN